jgi:putative ABC transport system substrate-binding protein
MSDIGQRLNKRCLKAHQPFQSAGLRRHDAYLSPRTDMRRREFIGLLCGAAAVFPLAARAQAKSPIRIGMLPLGSPSSAYDRSLVEAFRQGLRQAGLVESKDIVLDVVWIDGDPDQAVAQLIQRGAELLVPCGSSASVAVKRRTSTIPIVFLSVGNPIAMGLVDSLPRPGQNATGFADILADLSGKLVELAREMNRPRAIVDYLWHSGWPDGLNRYQGTEQAAQTAGVKIQSRAINDAAAIDEAIVALKNGGAATLIIQPSPFTYQHRTRIIETATQHGVGTIWAFPVAAREGAMIAYGPDYIHMYRRAPLYVERVLKGTKPADLPVELPSKVELLVNLKTAKALGREMPLSLLIRADELIE